MSHVIVVGSGVAGLIAALEAGRTHDVTLVTKSELAESNTAYAQGGIAAAMFSDDSVEEHAADTLRAGAGLSDAIAVAVLCGEGPARIRDLLAFGVGFDRTGDALARGLEAAHSHARVLHAGGDATGAEIERALVRAIRASGTRILEHTFLTDIIVVDGAARGVEVLLADDSRVTLSADAVVLASGGAGQLFRHTTNPAVATGDGIAAAWRAGAELADLEFYQFHPTALALAGSFLVSEAVRGEGAVLVNQAGDRFMLDAHPDAELAPRDVVARATAVEMAAQGGAPVLLDATALGADFLARRFPTIDAACRAAGLDWSAEPIPVTPAAHYWMGGVATDTHGRTSVPGLYAVGEVACTGAHGANRLASNSLLESVVFAHRAAQDLAATGPGEWSTNGVRSPSTLSPSGESPSRLPFSRAALQELLWSAAGLQRSRAELDAAAGTLAEWSATWEADDTRPGPEHRAALEDANLLQLAVLLVASARDREESRGAHFRTDFPTPSDAFAHHLTRAREASLTC